MILQALNSATPESQFISCGNSLFWPPMSKKVLTSIRGPLTLSFWYFQPDIMALLSRTVAMDMLDVIFFRGSYISFLFFP